MAGDGVMKIKVVFAQDGKKLHFQTVLSVYNTQPGEYSSICNSQSHVSTENNILFINALQILL